MSFGLFSKNILRDWESDMYICDFAVVINQTLSKKMTFKIMITKHELKAYFKKWRICVYSSH